MAIWGIGLCQILVSSAQFRLKVGKITTKWYCYCPPVGATLHHRTERTLLTLLPAGAAPAVCINLVQVVQVDDEPVQQWAGFFYPSFVDLTGGWSISRCPLTPGNLFS
jgi:hypothetical protein